MSWDDYASLVRRVIRAGIIAMSPGALRLNCSVALNNLVLVIDLLVVPDTDLSTWRLVPSAAGTLLLVYGLVWDAE